MSPANAPAPGPRPSVSARAGGALALLREPGWAGALLGVIALSVIFVLLGQWQFGRHEAKALRADRIEANYDAPTRPLADVLPGTDRALPADRQWQPVRVSGQYLPQLTVVIRNRPLDGVYGYEVLVPLRVEGAGGAVLLVDRGWIPAGATGAEPDRIPPPPPGRVDLVVRLRPGEPPTDRRPPPGQQLRIDLGRIPAGLAAAGYPQVYQAYGVLAEEAPAPPTAPTRLPRPDTDPGMNLPYAVQWWAFAGAAYLLLGHYLLREAARRAGTKPPDRPARPRRQELTDEEWEDAATR